MGTNTLDQPHVVDLTKFAVVSAAWRSPALSVNTARAGDEVIRGGAVVRLNGDEHRKRRRVLGQLLSRGGHQYFRDTYLYPTVKAALERELATPDADGKVRIEVKGWVMRINQQLAAGLVGFDAAATPEGAADLFNLIGVVFKGYQSVFDNAFQTDFDPDGPAQQEARAARAEMIEKYFDPAYARRVELARQVAAGELAEDQMPQDYLTLVALKKDPAWEDLEVAKREAQFLLTAGVHTTSFMTAWTLRELFEYFKVNPDERSNDSDPFLLGAAQEALRLHPVTKGFVRKAEDTLDLDGAPTIHAGDLVILENGPAGVETDVYGADAREFNPYREVPAGVPAMGMAFGAGPHMCFGMPLVMGKEGLDGSLIYLVRTLLNAGAELEPGAAQNPHDHRAARGNHGSVEGHHFGEIELFVTISAS